MWRLLPVVLLLAACETTSYSDVDDAKETCDNLGYTGAAHAQCMARRAHLAKCRNIQNSRDYKAADARAAGCE